MHCDYCEINYDVIGRVETLEEDLKYIADINNFSSDLPTDKHKLHVHPSGTKRFSPSPYVEKSNITDVKNKQDKTIKYFSLLSSMQLKRLYNMYELDFELFGYSQHLYVPVT